MPIIEEIEDHDEFEGMGNQDANMVSVVNIPKTEDFEDPSDDDIDIIEDVPEPSKRGGLESTLTAEQRKELRKMQMVYPCYFDKNRSKENGRRLPLSQCVENPLAYTIFKACKVLKIVAVLDAEKTHPQDWGNPGRVRIGCKWDGTPTHSMFKSKKQMLHAIAVYLQENPTTLANVKDLPGAPEYMEGEYKPQVVPKVLGFKMNTIVPLHSTLTMKNPNTAGVYIRSKTEANEKIMNKAKKMKMKVKRIRG